MKYLLIASLLLAPLAAAPAAAASIEDHGYAGQHRLGTFAGARLRIAMGGEQAGRPRLGLAMTGVGYSRSADGGMRTRFAEGVEYGFSAERRVELSLAGRPMRTKGDRLHASGGGGLSPEIIIGAGVAVIAIGAAIGVIDAIGDD